MRLRTCFQLSLLAAIVIGACVLNAERAEAGHRIHCDGYWSGYLFDYGGEEQEGDCPSWGEWHVSINTDTGEFNFHFHGDTDDSYCFGEHGDIYEYIPEWVEEELMYECGACVEYVDKTHYSIDHHGHVFLKVKGYAYPCDDEPVPE